MSLDEMNILVRCLTSNLNDKYFFQISHLFSLGIYKKKYIRQRYDYSIICGNLALNHMNFLINGPENRLDDYDFNLLEDNLIIPRTIEELIDFLDMKLNCIQLKRKNKSKIVCFLYRDYDGLIWYTKINKNKEINNTQFVVFKQKTKTQILDEVSGKYSKNKTTPLSIFSFENLCYLRNDPDLPPPILVTYGMINELHLLHPGFFYVPNFDV